MLFESLMRNFAISIEIAQLDEEIAQLDEEIAQLDKENAKLEEVLNMLKKIEEVYQQYINSHKVLFFI